MERVYHMGLIAEGPSDLAVLENIVKGIAKKHGCEVEIRKIRPDLDSDETDLQFSNWESALSELKSASRIIEHIENVTSLDGREWVPCVIVQVDTAETYQKNFNVKRPEDVSQVRPTVCAHAQEHWMDPKVKTAHAQKQLVLAVCVEETDAWVLALDAYKNDVTAPTDAIRSPKEKLGHLLAKKNVRVPATLTKKYATLSSDFKKSKELEAALNRNHSLQAFYSDLCVVFAPDA